MEIKNAMDNIDTESCTNADKQPIKNEAKPALKGSTQDLKNEAKLALKKTPQDLKTTKNKAKTSGLDDKRTEVKETKVEPRRRIRTYLKPRVPSFRKKGSKKKVVQDATVSVSLPTKKKKKKPPLPKFKSVSKHVKTKVRAASPRPTAHKASFQRKPPVPRFSTNKQRKLHSKKEEKSSSTFLSGQTRSEYQRRFKRKPALPDFSAIRKQKRLKISQRKKEPFKSKAQSEVKVEKGEDLNNTDKDVDSKFAKETEAVVQKKVKHNTELKMAKDSQTKIPQSEERKVTSAKSSTPKTGTKCFPLRKSNGANVRSSSAKPKKFMAGISAKQKQGLKVPKARLDRGRKARVSIEIKTASSKGTDLEFEGKASLMRKEIVKKSKVDLSLKPSDRAAADEAGMKKEANPGQGETPAGGGSFQEVERASSHLP